MENLDVCYTEYPAQMLLDKNMKRRARMRIFMGEVEYQGLGWWKEGAIVEQVLPKQGW